MIFYNFLKQLNAMPFEEALEIVMELCSPTDDEFWFALTIERHGKLETAKFYVTVEGHFFCDKLEHRHSLIYKYTAVNTTFGDEIERRIKLALKIESNYKLN